MNTIGAAILIGASFCVPADARVRVVPAPQYFEELPQTITIADARALAIVRRTCYGI
jgi:hypothetical protein